MVVGLTGVPVAVSARRVASSPPCFRFHSERVRVSLSDIDRQLLDRCLAHSPMAWKDFVDRFLGLVIHVANHTAAARGVQLNDTLRQDLISDVFAEIVARDHVVLRRFQRNCSLATYLTVIARRVIIRQLSAARSQAHSGLAVDDQAHTDGAIARLEDADEVAQLMRQLSPDEAQMVRMYHLEGMSYQQISRELGVNENSIGPVLSRARLKMRNAAQ